VNRPSTLAILFDHHRWAMEQVCNAAEPLKDALLDRPVEMGLGSLRKTIQHLAQAEKAWMERIAAPSPAPIQFAEVPKAPGELLKVLEALHAERNGWLAKQCDESLQTQHAYLNTRGEQFSDRLCDILLHVYNHGVHHRAQIVNMLRHCGVQPLKIDYIFYRIPRNHEPPHERSRDLIADYSACGDWAMARLFKAIEPLDDAALDRAFEMGLGSLRRTMIHIADAEFWWWENWRGSPPDAFPTLQEGQTRADIRRRFEQLSRQRNDLLAGLSDRDLERKVTARAAPGREFTFTLGDSMLQLGCHGTLHRAQMLNMLRRIGAATPGLDLVLRTRPGA